MRYLSLFLNVSLCLSCSAVWAQNFKADFVGVYNQRSVDSVISLAVLPENNFCLAVISGALDIQAPGKWEKLGQDSAGVRLKFTRASQFPSRFVVYSGTIDDGIVEETTEPKLRINTAAFSMLQSDAILGSSNGIDIPDNMAPLFSFDQSSFSTTEALPLKHRYLFLGYRHKEGGWRITRFDIGQPLHNVWVNLSEAAMQEGTAWESRFYNGNLLIQRDGVHSNMGSPKALSQEEADSIRKNCLGSPDTPSGLNLIRPQAEYHLDTLPVKEPWFGRDEYYGEDAMAQPASAPSFDIEHIKY